MSSEIIQQILNEILEDNTLEHHGVKGMRWGVRKRDRGGRMPTNKAHLAKTPKQKKSLKKKDIKSMSNSEIQDRTKRLESEKRLKELSDNDTSPGKKYIQGIIKDSGKQALTRIGTNAIVNTPRYIADKEFTGRDFVISLTGAGQSKKKKK